MADSASVLPGVKLPETPWPSTTCVLPVRQAPDPESVTTDVHLFSNVLHDWDVPEVKMLLAKSFDALPPGGLLVIHEAFINDEKTGPLPVAEYSAILMHSTQGKCYGTGEYREYLAEIGFNPGAYVDTAAGRGYMTAVKPE